MENVVQMPDKLTRLAKRIKDECDLQIRNRAEWIESRIRMWPMITEARDEYSVDQAFGDWWDKQDFRRPDGKSFEKNDRAAMVEMGRNPERIREVLTNCDRISPQHIYANEWQTPVSSREETSPVKRKRGRSRRERHDRADEAIADLKAAGKPVTENEVTRRSGVSPSTVHTAVAVERAKQEALDGASEEALAAAALAALPKTTKEKFDLALKHALKQLEQNFEERVRQRSQENDEKLWKPYYDEKLKLAETVVAGRNGVFTKAEYNEILFCLSPDHVASLGEYWFGRHSTALRLFRAAEIKLVDEQESPQMGPRPWTLEELDQRKAAVKAERAARRAAVHVR